MEKRTKPRFKRVYVEITNVCNLHCPFCSPSARAPAFLTLEQFDRVARQLRPYTDYLYFHLKGEPLLHPRLFDLLDRAGELGFRVNLTTNGVLLPTLGPQLGRHPALRQTNISLHSYTQAHGEMEGYVAALAEYARGCAAGGKHTVFRIWTLDSTRGMDDTAARLLGLLSREFPALGELGEAAGKRSVTLAKDIFLSFDQEFVWPSLAAPWVGERGSCYGARVMAGVLVDGTVVPCCLDGEGECPLGNLFEQPMEQILAEGLDEMAQGFLGKRATRELCRRCDYRRRFDP